MIALLQRVSSASVTVDKKIIGQIEQGLLVLLGIEKNDNLAMGTKLIDKTLRYRVFADANGRMNNSLIDINGGLLLVPQFTLAADTKKGLRPSFSSAAAPDYAARLFHDILTASSSMYHNIAQGQFGADMQVSLINDGPVTFLLNQS